MTIDLITTTFRNADKLRNCIEKVSELTKFVDYKWYIWCNSPNQEINNIIHESIYIDGIPFNDRIEPIYNDNNNGSFASNNNEAAKEGKGEYILFLNDDIEPLDEFWLLNMKRILDTDEKVGVVGALLLYPDKTTIQHCGVFFSHKTNNLPYHMLYRQPIVNVKDFVLQYRYYQAVTGACMLVRRKDFEDVGGFSEEFYYQYEDIALCLDIKNKLKKNCVYCPGAILVHNEGISKDGKQNPKFKENIEIFKKRYSGLYVNDLDFYLSDPNFMTYKVKNIISANDDSEEEIDEVI